MYGLMNLHVLGAACCMLHLFFCCSPRTFWFRVDFSVLVGILDGLASEYVFSLSFVVVVMVYHFRLMISRELHGLWLGWRD